ncbi:uncharacterized protein LOC123437636 [Hordeum vulgare subsp. vulgare]|uniref:uncharacterized protein LOC123437636 n=1 Tax=Hordeum vulgare subsp. vulgare TaxID=112509 RepID=UPI00162E9EED|nr:uncharacterized protein LOC123437636 [Hordeum vulgare subsp. vulgare]
MTRHLSRSRFCTSRSACVGAGGLLPPPPPPLPRGFVTEPRPCYSCCADAGVLLSLARRLVGAAQGVVAALANLADRLRLPGGVRH